jgi:hypothetical protein
MATPVESERKSWSLTKRGDRLAKIAQIEELIVAVGTKVSGEFFVIDARE